MDRMERLAGGKPRAHRFPVKLSVRYRLLRDGQWHEGKTANVSRSGMFFHVDEPLEPNTLLEVSLELPLEVEPGATGNVVCLGRVVRAHSSESGSPTAVATSIVSYYFARKPGSRDD